MLDFLYIAVSWVLLRWHQLLGFIGMDPNSGLTWSLSIVLLVVTARLLLFRVFVKQVHYQRNMQKMQPKIQKIREKYKNDRAEMNRQMMKFQQEEGFNPVAGCLPMFLQIPVFLGLYHVLRHLSNSVALCDKGATKNPLLSLYTFSSNETCSGARANLFGAPLAASFRDNSAKVVQLGGDITSTRWVILPLLVISAVATFATQLMIRATQTTAPEGTAATVQKFMLYVIPFGVIVSGLFFQFPLGVLLYWFTSNIWTFVQQAYIIRFHPPADEDIKPVGELGKTLAPRPGQRPVRMSKGNTGHEDTAANVLTKNSNAESNRSGQNGVSANGTKSVSTATSSDATGDVARGSVPRPGQRPNRANGKRPAAKRPTQAKKRR